MNQELTEQSRCLRGSRRYLAALSSILVLVVLGITGLLNIGSFQKSYIESLVSSYGIAGSEARRTIEYSVKYHKPLNNFAGMGDILESIKKNLSGIKNVYVLLPSGEAIYDTMGSASTRILPEKLLSKTLFS